jgi:hypothetical protein
VCGIRKRYRVHCRLTGTVALAGEGRAIGEAEAALHSESGMRCPSRPTVTSYATLLRRKMLLAGFDPGDANQGRGFPLGSSVRIGVDGADGQADDAVSGTRRARIVGEPRHNRLKHSWRLRGI